MCTSFIKKTGNNHYIAMNFDNNGMKYSIDTKKKDWFIVSVDTGKTKSPSFGVHKSGIFFNNLCVDPNGKGGYRRTKGVAHTTRFLSGIIDGKIQADHLGDYLKQTEIVNVPDWSTHNMVCGTQGSTWIIEPGRGNFYSSLKPGEFQIMTNVSVMDTKERGTEIQCGRYLTVKRLLSENIPMSTPRAFDILNAVKQSEGQWITEFSLVYDSAKAIVYYCEKQNFANICEYHFKE